MVATEHDRVSDAVDRLRRDLPSRPHVALILGSGLGTLVDIFSDRRSIPYTDIPHFPSTTAVGHAGNLVLGRVCGLSLVAFQGRFHLYEGHTAQTAAFPVRVARALGAEVLVVSNAAGGLNPRFRRGDLMVIEDQINLMFANPLIGPNDDHFGPRFPDMSQPYCAVLQEAAIQAARRLGLVLQRGVYAGLRGPTYETRAEYRFLRQLGADAVGMSTVPEVIAAVQGGMRVLGMSVITNECCPDRLAPTDGDSVVATANDAADRMQQVVIDVLGTLVD